MLQTARNKATLSILGKMRDAGPPQPATPTGIQQPTVPGQQFNPAPQTDPTAAPQATPDQTQQQQQAGAASIDMNTNQPVAGTNPQPDQSNFFQNQATNPMLARKNKRILGQ